MTRSLNVMTRDLTPLLVLGLRSQQWPINEGDVTQHQQGLFGSVSDFFLVRPTQIHQLINAFFGLKRQKIKTVSIKQSNQVAVRVVLMTVQLPCPELDQWNTFRHARALHPHTLVSTSSFSSSSRQLTSAWGEEHSVSLAFRYTGAQRGGPPALKV